MLHLMYYCLLGLAVSTLAALAQEMPAAAISPDGTTLLVAGDNRVLYTLDAETLAVSHRRYIPEQVRWLSYSSDGQSIYMRTQERTFAAHAAGSFKQLFGAEKIVSASYAPEARMLALLENNYNGGVLHIVAATSGKKVLKLEMPELRTDEVVLNADATVALMLTNSESSDAEEKAQPGSELKGYDKYDFRQKHDGYISRVVTADLRAGSFEVADTWYRVSNPNQVRMIGDSAAFVNSISDSGLVSADGSTTLFNMGEKFASFARIGDDGRTMLMSSGSKLKLHPLQGTAIGETSQTLDAGDIPGPAERVTSVAEAADGTLYLATSAYRVWKVAPGEAEVLVEPVF